MNEKIKEKIEEIERYKKVLDNYGSGRWFNMGRRHLEELYEELENLIMKLYCVISRESLLRMKGIRGKMMAQAGHAFLHAYWDSEERFPELAKEYKDGQHARKITLVVETDNEMLDLYEKYSLVCGTTKVIDAGFTVFDKPTLTCVGIGPLKQEMLDTDLKVLATLT